MSGLRCVRCGADIPVGEPAPDLCARCAAAAIAEPDQGRSTGVTASLPREAVCPGRPRVPELPLESRDDGTGPSILREHHAGLLELMGYNLLWVALLIACLMLLLVLS
jgi:hypothetical protein